MVLVLAACAPADESVRRYTLKADSGTVSTITAAARCGRVLFVAEVGGRIHRLDIDSGANLGAIDDPALSPMALAADCERGRVWAVSPAARDRTLQAVAIDLTTGKAAQSLDIPVRCLATSAVIAGEELFVGGECVEGEVTRANTMPDASTYYSGRRIGVRVRLADGAITPGLAPYEMACPGAGACAGGAVARTGGGEWIAALPAATRLGVYGADGTLTRTFDIATPGFTRDGTTLPMTARVDERVKWATTNSVLHRVFVIGGHVVVAHYLTTVPPGWELSSPERPQATTVASVFTSSGVLVRGDMPLADLPIGADEESLFVVDYGPKGKQGAHDAVTVVRMRIP